MLIYTTSLLTHFALRRWAFTPLASLALAFSANAAHADPAEDIVTEQLTRYFYGDHGQVTEIDGPRTDVVDLTTYTYDSKARRTGIINALDHDITFKKFNTLGQPGEIIDANNVTTSLKYRARGWLRQMTVVHPSGDTSLDTTTKFYYDKIGQVVKISRPDGRSLSYEYDDARRLTRIYNGIDESIEYDYDNASNLTGQTIYNAMGQVVYTTTQQFDELSRLTHRIDADDQAHEQRYTLNNLLDESTNARQFTTQHQYDSLGRLTTLIDADLGTTIYGYDAHNRIDEVTDANGHLTSYGYNAFDQQVEQHSPDTGSSYSTYDAANNRITHTDARGIFSEQEYDALNRLTDILYPAYPEENVHFHYDDSTDDNYGIGRLTQIDDTSGTTTYRYDHQGRVIEKSHGNGQNSRTVAYHYNPQNQWESLTYPSGMILTPTYDSLGRIDGLSVQYPNTETDISVVTDVDYLPFGPVTAFTQGNGLVTDRLYDKNYWLTDILVSEDGYIDTGLFYRHYEHDPNGNIEEIRHTPEITPANKIGDSDHLRRLTYDPLDRLTNAEGMQGPGSELGFKYDLVGNRTQKTTFNNTGFTMEGYLYQPGSNRLDTVSSASGIITKMRHLDYDDNGNITSDQQGNTSHVYTYNAANRPSTLTVGQQVYHYTYNALGQRTSKTDPEHLNERIHYTYDESGKLLHTFHTATNRQRDYVYLHDQLVAFVDHLPGAPNSSSTIYYTHNDHLATTQRITDHNQNIVWQVKEQTPFGNTMFHNDPDQDGITLTFDLRFPGQYFDVESGRHYNWHRTYDPELGRYLQSDPIGLGDGPNTYSYVYNNPVNYYDPNGKAGVAAAGLCFVPGVGWVGCGAVAITAAGAAAAVGICYWVGACSSGGDDNVVGPGDAWPGSNSDVNDEECPPDDDDGCGEWRELLKFQRDAILAQFLSGKIGVAEFNALVLEHNQSVEFFLIECGGSSSDLTL